MLKLESGTDFFIDDNGKRVCMGAKQGRPDNIPQPIRELPSVKLRMVKLQWVDGDYDQGGAYWGRPDSGKHVFCAWGKWGISFVLVQVFVWALTREEAKALVREKLPRATFFR